MFFDFGAGEFLGLGVLAVILVGPERLPKVASDFAKLVKKIKAVSVKATDELKVNLGPGYEDLQPTDLNPKQFLKKHIAGVLDESPDNNTQSPSANQRNSQPKIDPDLL